VKTDFPASHLRCPACGRDRTLRLTAQQSDEREVREGTLACVVCGATQAVHRGVGELMVGAPEHVHREAAGLERFAEMMRNDGWTPERIRSLPDVEDGYWYVQGKSIRQLWDTVDFADGQWLLDIGSNTCWASNFFASRGLNVIALDISLWEMQGLWTADYFIEDGSSYFERVLGSMNTMPIASGSLDYVYACEVLHHNDPRGLLATFEEAYRVLKPGGRMLVVNETLKTWHDKVGVHVEGVAEFEGYEHAHWALEYRAAAMRAGFATRLIEPSYHGFYREPPPPTPPPLRHKSARLEHELRRRAWGRRAFLMWANHIAGGVAFGMIATKPRRPATSPHSVAPLIRDLRRRAARSG
jgi:SAM-dependent methyltransferase